MGAFLFLHRMAEAVEIETGHSASMTADAGADRPSSFDEDVLVYHISGAFFFGATARTGAVL